VIVGQALGADLVGEAEAAKVLHRPRLRRIGLRVERRARLRIDEQAAHAAAAQLVGEHEPAGPPPAMRTSNGTWQRFASVRKRDRRISVTGAKPARSSAAWQGP
jgi:hypothetical protein